MIERQHTELVREGRYVAEVVTELIDGDVGWAPYISLDDAYRLDDVREALREGDLVRAARFGKVYEPTPVG